MTRQSTVFFGLLCYALLMALPFLEPIRLPAQRVNPVRGCLPGQRVALVTCENTGTYRVCTHTCSQ